MAGRKIRDEKDARRCMAAAARAGLTRGQWASKNGIDGRSLFAWGKNLDRGDKTRAGRKVGRKGKRRSGVMELVAGAAVTKSRYVVRCGKLSLELDDHFDEDTLARLLRVVAAC